MNDTLSGKKNLLTKSIRVLVSNLRSREVFGLLNPLTLAHIFLV